jgi:hypothetical protein
MRTRVKIGAACLAFVPMALYYLSAWLADVGLLPESIGRFVAVSCGLFDLPAFLILSPLKSYHVNDSVVTGCLVVSMLLWSSIVGWLFWQIAKEFLGENEPEFDTNPERAKFDWVGFRVRFVCGFVIGFLSGWRLVRNTTSKATMFAAMTIVGLVVGLAFGLYRPNFWSRP